MSTRFLREINVAVGDNDEDFIFVRNLYVKFAIHQEATSSPPKGNIEIYNLTSESETRIRDKGKRVRLWAGYQDQDLHLFFDGSLRRVEREKRQQERVTNIHIGGKDQQNVRGRAISISFKGPLPLRTIVEEVVGQMAPLELGNISAIGAGETHPHNISFMGPANVFLDNLLSQFQLEWYEENGVVNFSKIKKADPVGIARGEVVISEETGMVGSPAITENGIKVRTLLDYRLKLGSVIRVNSSVLQEKRLDSPYKVSVIEHYGDNWGGQFFTDMEAVTIDPDQPGE